MGTREERDMAHTREYMCSGSKHMPYKPIEQRAYGIRAYGMRVYGIYKCMRVYTYLLEINSEGHGPCVVVAEEQLLLQHDLEVLCVGEGHIHVCQRWGGRRSV